MAAVRFSFRYWLAAVLLIIATAEASAAIPQTERGALIALYNSAGGTNWEHKNGWNGAAGTECDWDGVVCDDARTAVVALKLSYNNMVGTLPALSALANLTYFDVDDNTLSGPIPALASLTKLQYFNVLNNGFSGSIPALTGLTSLQYFNVDSNYLSGPLPSLAGLTNLQVFDIGDNHHTFDDGTGDANGITGTLPSLTAFTQLQVFYVSGNKLSGTLPDLSPLKNLQDFEAAGTWTGDGNHFSGPVPVIAGLSALQYFVVSNNQLTGPVPSLANSPNLIGFSVSQNALSGGIPALSGLSQIQYLGFYADGLNGQIPSLSGLGQLLQISVGDNNLTGSLPSFAGLANLQLFDASYNQLTGAIPPLSGSTHLQVFEVALNELSGSIPSLAGLAELQEFDVAYNKLSGSLPAVAGSPALYQFSANDNQLTGSIPALNGLTQLTAVELSSNQLTGAIPAINGSPMLRYFSVARNQLTGSAPALTGLTALTDFNVSFNQLTGTIPALSGLTNLQQAYFDFNRFSGSIPALAGLKNLQEFAVGDNALSGSIPSVGGLSNLIALNVGDNQLTGALPALTGLANLQYVYASNNRLGGSLPSLDGLTNLNTFDVSFNQIAGTIPRLDQLPNLQYLYLDVNQLSGVLPNLNKLSNLLVFDADTNQLTGSLPALSALAGLQQFNVYSNLLTGTLPALSGLADLQTFQVGNNRLSGVVPAPAGGLVGGLSSLCPNLLTHTPNAAWDAATGTSPWYSSCADNESGIAAPTTKDSTGIVLSHDGSVRVFQSQQTDLTSNKANTGGQDIYSVTASGAPVLESVDAAGNKLLGASSAPAVSPDGKVVAFLYAPNANDAATVQLYAGKQGAPKQRVDTGAGGATPNAAVSGAPSLSSVDGVYHIAFCSAASNLVAGGSSGTHNVFLAQVVTQMAAPIQLVSTNAGTPINGDSCEPKLSGDGTKLAFSVAATGLFNSSSRQIVLKDLGSGAAPLQLITPAAGMNQGANGDSSQPAISDDGSTIAFTSAATNLDGLGTPAGGGEVFVSLTPAGTRMVQRARAGDGTVPNGGSQRPQISGDGSVVVMQTQATNLLRSISPSSGKSPSADSISSAADTAPPQCGAVVVTTNFSSISGMGAPLCNGTTQNQGPAISGDGSTTGFDSNAPQGNGGDNRNAYVQGVGVYTGIGGLAVPNLSGDYSGQWFDPNQNGQGLVLDVTSPDAGNQRALVMTWFVYVNGRSTWVQGAGVPRAGSGAAANSVIVQMDEVDILEGSAFPLGQAQVTVKRWGSATLKFTDANTGNLSWRSSYPGFGSGSMSIKHFLGVGLPAQDKSGAKIKACYSGNWFNPAQSGHGFELEVLPGDSPLLVVDWFAYAPNGAPVWLAGAGPISGDTAQVLLQIYDGSGAQFPPAFNPNGVSAHDWGTATFKFTDSTHAQVTWASTLAGYGSGTQPLQPIYRMDRRGCN